MTTRAPAVKPMMTAEPPETKAQGAVMPTKPPRQPLIIMLRSKALLASLAGIAGAMIAAYIRTKAFDLSMMINGCLGGLVGITAPCAFVSGG
ncbi:MAG: hypothetical protein AAFV29_13340, partial [Myxococcota bacterium]